MQVLAAFPLNIAYNAGYMHIAPVQMRPVCILPGPLLLLRRFLLRRWWFLSRHVLYYTLLQHQQVVCAVGFCLNRGRRNTAVKLCFAHDERSRQRDTTSRPRCRPGCNDPPATDCYRLLLEWRRPGTTATVHAWRSRPPLGSPGWVRSRLVAKCEGSVKGVL